MDKRINLKAETKEDLKVISTLLQDAAFKVGDMAFLSKKMRFAFVANRFRWELEGRELEGRDKEGQEKKHQRIRSGLRFEGVLNAAFQNLPVLEKNHILSLLSLEVTKKKGNFIVTLVFSNSISIRLNCEVLEVYLEDITSAWQTRTKPTHPTG